MVRTLATVALSFVLLIVFGSLLAGGDSAFANLLTAILPTVDSGTVARWIVTFSFCALLMVGASFVALAPPSFDRDKGVRRTVRLIDWGLPVGTLAVLFATFVAVQATVLFGGGGHVLRTDGLTYADYARTGFWQLSAVTVLTLLVIGVAGAKRLPGHRVGPGVATWAARRVGRVDPGDCGSALTRMWTYEQAYGFTRLRLLVSACELWLGLVFILVLAAGVRLSRPARWLPTAMAGTAVAALLGIAVLNPDGFIAERNIDRYFDTHRIDVGYLAELSPDAVPALMKVPEDVRGCALEELAELSARPTPTPGRSGTWAGNAPVRHWRVKIFL